MEPSGFEKHIMKKTSCGFLIKSAGLYLVCHATRLKQMPDIADEHWSLPKGQMDEGETELTAPGEIARGA